MHPREKHEQLINIYFPFLEVVQEKIPITYLGLNLTASCLFKIVKCLLFALHLYYKLSNVMVAVSAYL